MSFIEVIVPFPADKKNNYQL